MKKLYGILIAFLFIAIMLGGATEVKSQTSKSQISIEVIKEYQVPIIISSGGANSVSMGELQMFYREFMPILPYEPVNILLPFGEELDEVAISYSNEIIIDGTHDIEIYPMPIPTGTTGPIFEIVEEEVPATYPPEVLEVLDIVSYRGYSILPVNLFPVKYYTNEGKLSYFETIEVSITTRPSTDKTINKMFRGLPEDRQYLMGMVDTTTSISSYDGMQETLDLDPGDYDYVIITDDSFVPEFQPLIDWKNSVGIKTAIETVQNIQTNYSGADTQEKIRNFITDAYLNWSIEYVLLGGDIEFVPHRNLHFIFGGGEVYDIPADLYYAGLDGTWNEDGDEYWGEIGEDDLYAEVNVGRAPASTITDIIAFVNKTIAYETRSAGIDYYDDALFIGENLDSYPTWGGDYKDSVEPFFPPEFNITKLYERDETFGRTQIINEINAGKHFINNKGHGAVTYAGGLTTGDVMSLTNDEYFIWYSQCCDAGAFDSTWAECIAERVVANPDGGAVAFIGNSREGWYTQGSVAGPSIAFDKEFFNVLFNENIENIGRTLQRSKENSGVIGMMRWTYYTLNLIGDPTLKVGGYFASPPQDLTADAGDSFVSLTWDPPKEETAILNYNIYRGTSSGGEVLLATIGDILWFNDTSVTNGQTYYYYVTAVNAEREGLPSNEVNATPGIPTVPLDLQATPGDTVVHLTWNPPMDDGGLGITNYNIYRGTMSGGEVYLTMIGNVLNYDDGAVANGQTYYYKVAAVNAFTEGGMSNEAYATPGIPSAPLNLSTNAGDCYVNVTWLPPVQDGGLPITSYSIYRGLNSGEAIYHDTIGNQLYYHDTSVELDISYFYQVSAVNSFTEGPLSEEVFGKPSAAIWPMFLRDIEHSSTSPYDTSDNDLTLRWSFRGPRGSSPSPAIGVDGTIYFTLDEFFYAISPGGKLQWNQTLGDIITASPAIAGDGTIYVGCSDNLLYAFNPDGTIKWTFNAKKTVRTPTIGRDGTIYFGADNDKIFAVNPDGTEKWFYRLKGTIRDSVAIGKDGTIYCGVLNDKFMAFDPNGNLKWEYDAGYPFYNSPCISTDGTIYITSGVNLIAFDQNGTVKWTHTMDTVIISSSPIAGPDGTIYVSGSGKNYAVNPDGTRKWTYNGGGVYSPSMAIGSDGTIYTGGGTNEFLALNPDGSLKHSYGLSSYISVVSAPAIGKDGALYFITTNGWTNEGELYALGSSSYNAPVKNTDTGEQFDEIQAAIDDKDTVDGHTITVEAGTYYENLEMNKALTIIGEDRDNTIINGSSDTPPLPWPFTMGNVVNITSNLANITGFTITGGSYGIFILESHNISISENNISDNKYSGIWSIVSDNITIDSNIILNNGEEGIYIWTSKNNKITNNQVSQSAQNGIHIFDSNYNLFSDNIISFNDENGLLIEGCYNNILKDNIISKNANGMFLRNSDDNTITNNFIENNDGYGILLYSSDNSNANNNTCQS
ncbi:MAG: PQQ-binding-like beta-propeller repeat protein, partial [Thermoplasmata archaeon]|nr:PQQ-binding-like beta-propeller repeat protein [Thermoplasmata archaeon]